MRYDYSKEIIEELQRHFCRTSSRINFVRVILTNVDPNLTVNRVKYRNDINQNAGSSTLHSTTFIELEIFLSDIPNSRMRFKVLLIPKCQCYRLFDCTVYVCVCVCVYVCAHAQILFENRYRWILVNRIKTWWKLYTQVNTGYATLLLTVRQT